MGSVAVKGKTVLNPDGRVLEACQQLRHYVEHLGKRANEPEMKDKIHMVRIDGVEVGYRLIEDSPLLINPYFTRVVYVKTPGWNMLDFKTNELAAIKTAVFDVFFSDVQSMPQILIPKSPDCMTFVQRFEIAQIHRGNERFSNKDLLHKGIIL